jgi:hypothetical protein
MKPLWITALLLAAPASGAASNASEAAFEAIEAARHFSSKGGPCAEARRVIADGDLVFLALDNFLYRRVGEATNSWASHVGIAFQDSRGRWFVYESKPPLGGKTPLCRYVKRAKDGRFAVLRLGKPLSPVRMAQVRAFSTRAGSYRKPYHLGFKLESSNTSFCSKFVRDAYASGGVEIGRIETFRDLLASHDGEEEGRRKLVRFFESWFFCRRYFGSVCRLIGGDADASTAIPWDRKTVTPASQLNDPRLKTVLSMP